MNSRPAGDGLGARFWETRLAGGIAGSRLLSELHPATIRDPGLRSVTRLPWAEISSAFSAPEPSATEVTGGQRTKFPVSYTHLTLPTNREV